MCDLTIRCNTDDEAFRHALLNAFGDDVVFLKTHGFDGAEWVFVAVIPLVSVTVQVVDFFMTHFSKKQNSGRVIIKDGKEVSIEGYTADEVKSILESIIKDEDER